MSKITRGFIIAVVLVTSVLAVSGGISTSAAATGVGTLPTLCPQLPGPPDGFNPLVATANELAQYGFPPRPTDPEQLNAWEDVMSHAVHYVKPEQHASTGVHGLVTTSYSTNWAGYVVRATDNQGGGYVPLYVNPSGGWTQPTYNSGSADPSFWNGIGGFNPNSNGLVQAGADSNALAIGGTTRYEFWVEDWPLGTIWQAQPAVHAGDKLYVSTNKLSGNQAMAYLENQTTGQYTFVYFNCPYYDGSTEEFIYEAVGVPNLPYGSWGSTTFTNSWVGWIDTGGNGHYAQLGTLNYVKVIMTTTGTPGGTLKGMPSNISNNINFTITSY